MQELIINRVEKKMSKKEGGNPFYVVFGEGGEEMTSFDAAFEGFGKGTRLNVEPKVSGRHVNISKFEVLEAKAVSLTPAPGLAQSDMAKEDWEKKQRIERTSFEVQTAFKGIIELASTEQFQLMRSRSDELKAKLDKVLDGALDWADRHFLAGAPDPNFHDLRTGKLEPRGPEKDKYKEFKNVGELLMAYQKEGGTRKQAHEKWGLTEGDDLTKLNLTEAWEKLHEEPITP